MYLLDFGNIQFTDNNIKGKIEYLHQINPDGDMMLGTAAMAELKFTLYDLNHIVTDADITGREFTFKKSKASVYASKWDIFKASKPDIMCLNGDTVYSVEKNVFSIGGKPVAQQPADTVQCIYIVGNKVYLGHSGKMSVYTLQGAKQADVALTPFQKTQIVPGASLNMQGDILKEYSTRLLDMKPTDFVEKTSVFTQVGIFSAVTPERMNKTNIVVTSYDRMYKFIKIIDNYINNLAYPVTAFNLLKALCQEIGVPLLTTSITNGNYSISEKFSVSNTTARTILQYIAELSGNFAYIDAMGRLVVRFYESTAKTYASSNFKTIRQREYTTAKIDKVQVKVQENDIGVIVPKDEKKPNAYVIENNPLMYTQSDAELRPYVQALFDKLKSFQYVPTEFTTVLDNDFEGNVGELVTINGTQTPIFVKRVKGLIETYTSSGEAVRSTQTTRLHQSIQMLNGRTNEIIANIDEFSVTLTEVKTETQTNTGAIAAVDRQVKTNTAQIKVQADGLLLKANQTTVDALGKRVSSAESSISVQAGQISSKVSETDYNGHTITSLINQTPTDIVIDAERIDLQGYVTIKDLQAENLLITGRLTSENGSEKISMIQGWIEFYYGSSFKGGLYTNSNERESLTLSSKSGSLFFASGGYLRGRIRRDGTFDNQQYDYKSSGDIDLTGYYCADGYRGDSGTFEDKNGRKITVKKGIIIDIS